MSARLELLTFKPLEGLVIPAPNVMHWGLDDPAEVEGSDEGKLRAFRRTEQEVATRLRPFIEVALRAAGRTPRAAIA